MWREVSGEVRISAVGAVAAGTTPAQLSILEECELAGFGHKPCGGPREYLAWCSRTTDVKTLRARLEALEQAETAWQEAAGLKSNCGLTRKPRLRWEQGECRAR